MSSSNDDANGRSSAAILIERRAQLLDWIEKLDESADDVPTNVVERVRNDYQSRLDALDSELALHRTSLEEEMKDRTSQLDDAESRYDSLTDEHAELELRRRVGEISEEEWNDRSSALKEEIHQSEAVLDELRQEVARIDELLAILNEQDQATRSRAESYDDATVEMPPPPITGGARVDWMNEYAVEAVDQPDAPPPFVSRPEPKVRETEQNPASNLEWESLLDTGVDDERPVDTNLDTKAGEGTGRGRTIEEHPGDMAFLEELDRALAATSDPTASLEELRDDESLPVAQPGRKCPECGYTNPVEAERCEMCDTGMP